MTAIIPFESGAKLPAYLAKRAASSINRDVLGNGGAKYPVLSIKGKVFTLVKGSEKKLLTREIDGEEEAVQSLQVSVVRANTKYRVFYATSYQEGESDGKKPTCFSTDGVAPDAHATEPQSKKCQGCQQNVWGVRDGKGTACSVKTRLAIIDPANMNIEEPFLLNVPAASRAGFAQLVEQIDTRGAEYNAAVIRMSFDKEAASPKLVFKPVGWLSDDVFAKVSAAFDSPIVREMVGLHDAAPAVTDDADDELGAPPPRLAKSAAPAVSTDDIDDVVEKPKAAKPAAPKAEKPKAKSGESTDFLSEIDALLGNTDD
jgi:hypothetical protein